ncbi:hypothetical protein HPP92_008597 [Vanilla planifolia]|uniref:SHSP domain-containing protein n=1 Tax=Vanilla planifolia TaxID=51239 RepID=A0A835V5U0_VANPL|nr:hypothetical protein HPP92_008597 [Vanilla planifolia]
MDFFEDPIIYSAIHQFVDIPEEKEKAFNPPTSAYFRDRKAMARTPADVKDLSGAYEFVIDMPGVNSSDIKVQVEEGNLLVVSGEKRRGEEKEVKYLRMERRMGKFMRKFPLPENANLEATSAEYKGGVLTVTIEKNETAGA